MFVVHKPQVGEEWRNVIGGAILFAPIDRALVRRARRVALENLGRDEHGPEPTGDPNDTATMLEDLGDALSHAMILEGARDWRGAVQAAEGGVFEPLPFSREALADLLSDPVYFDAVDAVYVLPYATREREKNGSAASPSGTGEVATPVSGTASIPANPSAPGDAKPVPTARKRSKRTKPKASGTS
ncbi:hypothetical protein ASE70_15060 [Sphingomonas sp. Leaf22]|uniref:hypothetical protein n=1 Tax=Sphingomonas sp. Leaf22 TaxID=1735687 RepID=UPI0006F57805|nr:hypothetical protein [Sphingomonas sp. Leaf22]KQM92231.1 hypothetical protein ASE70_15060 [Sphingomonas sp. Leaf22]